MVAPASLAELKAVAASGSSEPRASRRSPAATVLAASTAAAACCGRLGRGRGRGAQRRPRHTLAATASAVAVATASVLSAPGGAAQESGGAERVEVAAWHAARRRAILEAHPEVADLCGPDWRTLPLLVASNIAQLGLAVVSGNALSAAGADDYSMTLFGVLALATGVGGTLSLWSFSVLHDMVHGTVVRADKSTREALLFWLSFPTIFGYHLYLQRGHLAHHRNLGRASMGQLFESSRREFEDGDVLFVAHRQPLVGRAFEWEVPLPGDGEGKARFSPSISFNVFSRLWDRSGEGPAQSPRSSDNSGGGEEEVELWRAIRNGALYSFSMTFERCALAVNDKLVAITGTNYFFPNKPAEFQAGCATYARCAALLHAALFALSGPGALIYLLVAELAWQLPIHPGCGMFVSNHGSGRRADGGCAPTASLYVGGAWGVFDWICMFSNYHLEHHDFPDVGLLRLPEISRIAPEFFGLEGSSSRCSPTPAPELAVALAETDWVATLRGAFATPQPYACSRLVGVLDDGYSGEQDSAAWAASAAIARAAA